MGYGDGSIFQRSGDKGWVAKYCPRPGAKMKYLYGKTEAEVKRKLRAYKQSADVVQQQAPARLSVEEYLLRWLAVFKKPTVKPSTYDRIESVVRGTIVPYIGDTPLGCLDATTCQKFINQMLDDGKSYWVIKKAYDALNDCLRHAAKAHDIDFNPMVVVGAPTKANFEKNDTRALTAEEESAFLAELDRKYVSSGNPAYNYKDAFILILNTGLRLGEVIALDWSDVDFEAKTISVTKTATMVRRRGVDSKATGQQDQVIQPTPKTKSGNRVVPLNAKAVGALQRLKGFAGNSVSVLNTSTYHRPLGGALLKQAQLAYERCGITKAGVHTLRHTFATRLFERGAQLKDVSVLLGHASIAITANTYIHVIEERKQNIVDLLVNEKNG